MSLGKKVILCGVGIGLLCMSAFSATHYAKNNQAYSLSGGPQIARAVAALNGSMKKFSATYTKLTGPSIEEPYVDISNARKQLKEASSSLETAIREAEGGIEVLGVNGFDSTIAENGLNTIRHSRETVSSILASLPSGSRYHGGREQSLLVEANTEAKEAMQVLRRIPSGSNYGLWRNAAIVTGIGGLFAFFTGTVFYKRLTTWVNKKETKKSDSS